MNGNEIKKQLKRFFRSEESKEGRKLIDMWYHFFDDQTHQLEGFDSREKEELRREIFHEVRQSAGISDHKMQPGRLESYRSKRTWPYKMAAGFAVLLITAFSVFLMVSVEPAPVEYITSNNPAGQSSRITLSDGSTIWLSANSTLEYPDKFEGEYREVILQGEAFFDVVSNPNQPFIVKSGDLQTRVLGTSFNIRAFEDEEDIMITVATGRVSVEQTLPPATGEAVSQQSMAFLYPEQQLVYNNTTGESMTHQVDSRLFTSWKDGVLMFENHTLEEIAARLERWYGVEIQFTDPELKKARFRIMFENTSLEHALKMVQAIKDFEFEIEERQVWIR